MACFSMHLLIARWADRLGTALILLALAWGGVLLARMHRLER